MKNVANSYYKSYSESIILPDIIQVDRNLFCLAFKNMKLLPAKYMIQESLKKEEIDQSYTVLETSSGNFALGMAITCQELGMKFHVVSDPAIDSLLKNRIEDLGGKVSIVNKTKGGNYQEKRLELIKEILDTNKKSYWTEQYNNKNNPRSYAPLAEMIFDVFGKNISLVGSVGTGGSTCGTIKYLREIDECIKLIGVDTFGSVIFGLENQARLLRGLGNSVVPKNIEHNLFDEIHWVTAEEAFSMTRMLHSEKGLFLGPTSGAAFIAARYEAIKNPKKNIVFISPDDGSRYLDTVYSDIWLKNNHIKKTTSLDFPKKNNSPRNEEKWSYINWNRSCLSLMENK